IEAFAGHGQEFDVAEVAMTQRVVLPKPVGERSAERDLYFGLSRGVIQLRQRAEARQPNAGCAVAPCVDALWFPVTFRAPEAAEVTLIEPVTLLGREEAALVFDGGAGGRMETLLMAEFIELEQ